MKHYKDTQNNVYAYESDGSQDKFILPGLVPITDAQADALRAAAAPQFSPAEQIEALERQHMLPRPVRDVMLGIMEKEALAAGVPLTVLRAKNAGYRKVKELDEQIAALRVQL